MNDHDPHLGERMERAVRGLRAPDVAASAMTHGRRQRTRRRLAYGAGGVAAITALAVALPAFAGDWPGRDRTPSSPVVVDPATTGSAGPRPSTPPATDEPGDETCGAAATGWWSRSTEQIRSDLSALLPAGVGVGVTDDDGAGTWGGNLTTAGDEDFASLTLLPPPGTPSSRRSLKDLEDGGTCFGGSNEPMQAVKPCEELTGHVACEEIRSDDGTLVGVVTERVEQTVVDGREQPTDKTYVLATVAGPDGGHVELYVAEGTRADRPHTVHDPADVPALTLAQVREIVTDPVWTS